MDAPLQQTGPVVNPASGKSPPRLVKYTFCGLQSIQNYAVNLLKLYDKAVNFFLSFFKSLRFSCVQNGFMKNFLGPVPPPPPLFLGYALDYYEKGLKCYNVYNINAPQRSYDLLYINYQFHFVIWW